MHHRCWALSCPIGDAAQSLHLLENVAQRRRSRRQRPKSSFLLWGEGWLQVRAALKAAGGGWEGTEQRVGTRGPRGHHCDSLGLVHAYPWGEFHLQPLGLPGTGQSPAGAPSATAFLGGDHEPPAAGGGEVPPPCPAPAPLFSRPKDREPEPLSLPKAYSLGKAPQASGQTGAGVRT